MIERTIRRSQLLQRIPDNYEPSPDTRYTEPVSFQWVIALVDALDTSLHTMNMQQLPKTPADTDRLRWELARIPIKHEFFHYYEETGTALIRQTAIRITQQEYPYQQTYHDIGSEACPYDVFWQAEHQQVIPGTSYWCFYDIQTSQELLIEPIYTWQADNSIVDWITQLTEQPDYHNVSIVKTDTDTLCTIQRYDEKVLTRQRILAFIQQHQPVSRKQILAQNFAHTSRVDKLLRKLQDEYIQRDAHGIYVISNDTL